jgi:AbrB family looped-hinge helix DNA binding protein
MTSLVTSGGRITLPKRLRVALNLRPGSKLKLEQGESGEIRLLKFVAGANQEPDRFEPYPATDELLALLNEGG